MGTTPEDSSAWARSHTERLALSRPTLDDLAEWHTIHSDPRVWEHFPSGIHTSTEQTESALAAAIANWEQDGLGYWSVRTEPGGVIVGCGGCRLVRDEQRWNLYYRFTPEVQGNGYAAELAGTAVRAANSVRSDWPVVAYMLEHNIASWKVAERIGMQRLWSGPDAGNPDPSAIRLVYGDRNDETTAGIART